MPAALPDHLPTIDPDELAWLATLPDVESRLVRTERHGERCRYRVVHGPFAEDELANLPERDWTLLVNDVEKHLPALRAYVDLVDCVPDWRIDDLMISFAVPGGSVGPHRDNYDVFLCQGLGTRRWTYTQRDVRPDPAASQDLALLRPFDGDTCEAVKGDVLYLPLGIAHWGIAEDACLTYSIGMRAPRRSELAGSEDPGIDDPFYEDGGLTIDEVRPGYISPRAIARARALLADTVLDSTDVAQRLGRFVTRPKDWLRPDTIEEPIADIGALRVHGMARMAWDDDNVYLNGASRPLAAVQQPMIAELCATRENLPNIETNGGHAELIRWLARNGAFEMRP